MAKFSTKSSRLQKLHEEDASKISGLMALLEGSAVVYIDYANIKPWSDKLGWHIDLKRFKQLLEAIDVIQDVYIYYGTLLGDPDSEKRIKDLNKYRYKVVTKPVKIMRFSVDATSVPEDSPELLKSFMKYPLLKSFTLDDIKYLNGILYRLNTQGIMFIEDRKCNFDVEIGRQMLTDYNSGSFDTFILCGGDSDFEEPIKHLLDNGKNVILMATTRRISRELGALRTKGLKIFEISKLRSFICWPREDAK